MSGIFSSSVHHSQLHEDAVDLGPHRQVVHEALELFPGELLQLDPVCLMETKQIAFERVDGVEKTCTSTLMRSVDKLQFCSGLNTKK